ncbi:copper resistance protein B [Croceicoccus bisphenolivorans]|uniref:copper resistance protein B n=1 Tax=Croceicoccus bisphenolivorans TaxID=1783232 RepID=UPI000A7A9AF2|nr:copper resistance protein B [Croceicoccus bisphenolivorans]
MRRLFLTAVAATAFSVPAIAHDHDGMDHSQMGHHEGDTADETVPVAGDDMDHGQMDHGAMDHGQMDHSMMDHSMMDMQPDAGGMEEMDHSTMDHGQMDHSMHHGAQAPQVSDQPGDAPPPPVPTDHAADAVFGPDVMAQSRVDLLKGMAFTGFFAGLDTLEYRAGEGADGYVFDGEAWYGGDIDRAVLAFSGEGAFGEKPEDIEIDAYWRHAINPWFNLQLGARHDFRPDPERTYALVGVQGLAPYWIEVEAQAFVSEKGDVHFRGTAMHDMRLTQRLVFEPEAEVDFALQDVPELGIGGGLDSFELSGRLRYEIQRNFAPYVGFSWERKVGGSADYARDEGEDPSRFTWLAGLRFWF